MENGVNNLKGAGLFPKTFSNHGFGDASLIQWDEVPVLLGGRIGLFY